MSPSETAPAAIAADEAYPPIDYRGVVDRAFLLRLLAKANPRRHHMGAVKPNKFAYLASRKAQESGIAGFRYRFLKAHLGPMSSLVYSDLGRLFGDGMLKRDNALSARGETTLEDIESFFHANPQFTAIVDGVSRAYGSTPRYRLVDQVHLMQVGFGRDAAKLIDDVPDRTLLFDPNLSPALEMSPEWGETLLLAFDSEARGQIERSKSDVAAGRVRQFSRWSTS